MLEDLGRSDSINFTIYLAHEGDGDVRHKVEHIYRGPATFAIEVGWVRPLVSRRALEDDRPIGHKLSFVLIIPIVDGLHVVFFGIYNSSVFEKPFAEDLTNGLRELKHSRDDARAREEDVSVLELKASPALTDHHEVRKNLPDLFAHLDEEGVSIGLHGI